MGLHKTVSTTHSTTSIVFKIHHCHDAKEEKRGLGLSITMMLLIVGKLTVKAAEESCFFDNSHAILVRANINLS